MITLMIVLFVIGYACIAMEHTLKVNKAAIALLMGCLMWVMYVAAADSIGAVIHAAGENGMAGSVADYVISTQLVDSVGDICETLLFLVGAMTVVELIDANGGFSYVADVISTRDKKKLLWIISFFAFFLSAVLDNLTTTIVMVMLLRTIITDDKLRALYGCMVVLAANAGGAWSPIGDVTTIMLWIQGNITAAEIIPHLILPSLVSMIIPAIILSLSLHGEVSCAPEPAVRTTNKVVKHLTNKDKLSILTFGILVLVLTPVFKALTGLPPFIGVLLGLSLLWIFTEVLYNRKRKIDESIQQRVNKVLHKIDGATLLFFFGILLAVDSLKYTGVLKSLSGFLMAHTQSVYLQDGLIGVISSIVDNVPLVAGAIGMYPIDPTSAGTVFVTNGDFWSLLAYCAGVGGSLLIVGSAAGVVLMGLERISFGWYFRHITPLALIGYLSGMGVYALQGLL